MELLWGALSSSATLCWLGAQILSVFAGLTKRTPSAWLIQRGLSFLSSVLYLVALILLVQIGFLGDWPRFWSVLGLVILLTIVFGGFRYFKARRRYASQTDEQKDGSNVSPR